MPEATPNNAELVRWFTTDDLEKAELSVAQLAKGDIKAVLRPDCSDSYMNRYEVWLKASDLKRARRRMEAFERTQRDSLLQQLLTNQPYGSQPEHDVPYGHPASRFLFLGYALLVGGTVLSACSIAIGPCLVVAGMATMLCCHGFPRFRQYQLIDLFALVSFLPAAIGLTIAHTATAWTARPITLLAGLICTSVVLWVGMIGVMNRAYCLSAFARLAVWVPLSLVLGIVWFLVWTGKFSP